MTHFRNALTLLLVLAGTSASADDVYTATLTAAKGLGKKTAELVVTVTKPTTEEEAARIQKILKEQGSDAAVAEVRKADRGVASIVGGLSSPIRHVRAHPGQHGSRVIIITDGPLYFPEDTPSPSTISKSSVGLIELVVDDTGKGRGNMVEALKVNITEDGVFQVVTPGATKIELENVRKKP
jgi:hypothetical protein